MTRERFIGDRLNEGLNGFEVQGGLPRTFAAFEEMAPGTAKALQAAATATGKPVQVDFLRGAWPLITLRVGGSMVQAFDAEARERATIMLHDDNVRGEALYTELLAAFDAAAKEEPTIEANPDRDAPTTYTPPGIGPVIPPTPA